MTGKSVKAWAGFLDGRLAHTLCDDAWGGKNVRLMPALFKVKRDASVQYDDVRQVEIREIKRKRK